MRKVFTNLRFGTYCPSFSIVLLCPPSRKLNKEDSSSRKRKLDGNWLKRRKKGRERERRKLVRKAILNVLYVHFYMCIMYILYVHFVCTFYMYILCVHFIFAFYVCILCVHFMCTFYMYILYVHFICTCYMYVLYVQGWGGTKSYLACLVSIFLHCFEMQRICRNPRENVLYRSQLWVRRIMPTGKALLWRHR